MTETTNIPISDPVQQTMEQSDKRVPRADHKRLFLVIACLFVLVAVGILVRWKQQLALTKYQTKEYAISVGAPSPAPTVAEITKSESVSGMYYIEPGATDIAKGDKITLSIYFDAKAKMLDGADSVLTFDPAYFSVTEDIDTQESEYFDQIPRVNIDNAGGRIEITGFSPKTDQPITAPVLFFRVHMLAKKEGEARVDFLFNEGSTNQSTLVEKGTSKNILGSVQGVTFHINP